MASKVQRIYELSQSVSKNLSDYDNWTAFLKTAAWQYKYPFYDQLLIYAQRPDATACASIEVWNKRLNSWINRGSQGIALLREGDRGMYLDYVFDISDTHSNNAPVKLWQYQNRFENAVIETLENSFGELKVKSDIQSAVISAAENVVSDNKADYLSELKYAKENSFLEDLDDLNIDVEFQQTAETSIAYMILYRLGIEPESVFEREDFPHIMNFNTPQTLSVLGSCVSSIAEDALRDISQTFRAELKAERSKIFAEYLSELHKDDNGSKTIALLPLGDFYECYGEDAENGISPRYVQEMLGHSKLEFTLKYYTHTTGYMADMARMAIDKMLNVKKSF